ncbi:hypothetical protein RI367_002697 [Sorochytrium milnesiophthora]
MPSPFPENETTCSMADAFDALIMCNSLRQQALHYYRYGEGKKCGDKWEDFKFCLSVKAKSAEVGAQMVRERKEKQRQELAKKPSSLDVWELRTEPPANFPPDPDTFAGLGFLDEATTP